MGCWNATCGLSNLPIFYGDRVVALVIQKEGRQDNSPCYPWTNWSPASLLVRGGYNDYGGVDILDPTREMLALTQRDASRIFGPILLDSGETVYGNSHCETFCVNDQEDDDRHSLAKQPDGFALWMAHADLFDDLRINVKIENYFTDFKSRPIYEVVRDQATVNIKTDKERAANNKERIAKNAATNTIDYDFTPSPWSESVSEISGAASRFLRDELRSPKLLETDEAIYMALIGQWSELRCLYYVMQALRITLAPLGGAGSQDGDLRQYATRNKAFNAQIKRLKEKHN